MRARMLAGELYRAEDPEIQEDADRALRLTHRINSTDPTDRPLIRQLLGELLGHLGEDVTIWPPFRCDYGYQISIGARTFANWGLVCLDTAPVTIGADVQIGPGVHLMTATHPLDAELRRDTWESAAPIAVHDNVWLGGGAIVCPGVTIGENTVVGAGSVVTRDLPADVVAVGSPARVIRRTAEHPGDPGDAAAPGETPL